MNEETLARFESRFVRSQDDDCWMWAGSIRPDGYGNFSFDGNPVGAHRYAYSAYIGPIPHGLHVLRRCDQPLCVNPAHLWAGTHADNMADKVKKGRQARGDGHVSSKLTGAQVLEIRAACGEKHNLIAARYGVSRSLVSTIRRGEVWKHLPAAVAPNKARAAP